MFYLNFIFWLVFNIFGQGGLGKSVLKKKVLSKFPTKLFPAQTTSFHH